MVILIKKFNFFNELSKSPSPLTKMSMGTEILTTFTLTLNNYKFQKNIERTACSNDTFFVTLFYIIHIIYYQKKNFKEITYLFFKNYLSFIL